MKTNPILSYLQSKLFSTNIKIVSVGFFIVHYVIYHYVNLQLLKHIKLWLIYNVIIQFSNYLRKLKK